MQQDSGSGEPVRASFMCLWYSQTQQTTLLPMGSDVLFFLSGAEGVFPTNEVLRLTDCLRAQERAMEQHRRCEITGSFRKEQRAPKHASPG